MLEHVKINENAMREVNPTHSWVSYLEWLGVKVEGPQNIENREE